MLSKLVHQLSFRQQSFALFYLTRRSISQNVIRLNKPPPSDDQLAKNQPPKSSVISEGKIIDAHIAKPAPQTQAEQMLERLRELSSKNRLLAAVLERPINILVWTQLSKQEKIDSSLRSFGEWLAIIGFFIIAHLAVLYCYLEENEITKRKHVRTIGPKTLQRIDELMLEEIMTKYEGKFIDSSKPIVNNVDQVLQKLIDANKEFVDDENFDNGWSCIVIDDDLFDVMVNDEMKFVIFTKPVLEMCKNEHQLAYLVANALSHYVLKHKREPLSNLKPYQFWTNWKLTYFPAIVKVFNTNIFKDAPAQTARYLQFFDKIDQAFSNFMFRFYRKMDSKLCYSDTLEEEADRIALQLLARSCFDVREVEKVASAFQKLAAPKPWSSEEMAKHRYIYKHAFNDHKLTYMQKNLAKFVEFRQKCGCAPLS